MRTSLSLVIALSTLPLAVQAGTPGYGARSQVGQLTRTLDNPNRVATIKPTFVARPPLLQKMAAFLRPGISTHNDVRRIEQFLAAAEARYGMPISTLAHPALKDGQRMRAEKAFALDQFNRRPDEVTETFLRTRAKVQGVTLADRDLFVQRWKPIGKPSGKVIVIAPGFLETGRSYYEQAHMLNLEGHDVIIMDQQWAGYTADAQKGVLKGAIDRGFGISRDFADVAAYGNEIMEKEYGTHPGKKLIVAGVSMGGGLGVIGALTMYDAGKLDLGNDADGKPRTIPADRGFIPMNSFLGRTKNVVNDSLDLLGRIPGVRELQLPAIGLPQLSNDPRTNVKIAAHAVEEDIRARPRALRAALPDIATIRDLIARGHAPKGRGYVIHAAHDSLANPQLLRDAVTAMLADGADITLDVVPGTHHVMEETAGEQREILKAVRHVAQ